MLQFISWYLLISLLGLVTFPLAYRLLPALTDRGYALSRALGLLIWAFVFWLAVSLGLAQNNAGGLVLALLVLVGLGLWSLGRPGSFRGGLSTIFSWLRPRMGYVLSVEALFLIGFALWAFVRANNPDIIASGGEKWMEEAFINAIMRSPTFPPHDPWLSGYAISYYYFGYVMSAMLAEITGTTGGVAFNLMVALIFGLSVIGAYGLLYNLLGGYWERDPGQRTEDDRQRTPAGSALQTTSPLGGSRSRAGALLGPLFLLLLGNWEAVLEVLHKRGIGWSGQPGDVNFWTRLGVGYPTTVAPGGSALPAGVAPPYNFWTWLNIPDLKDAPRPVLEGVLPRLVSWVRIDGLAGLGRWIGESFMPDRAGWWWWRASRVVTDYDLRGGLSEIIDEFPAFSYLLGDLHPHVLAMPFGLLVGALALNLYLGGWQGQTDLFRLKLPGRDELSIRLPLRLDGFCLLAVVVGGMAFLNTWDFPIYLALVCGALVLRLVQQRGWTTSLLEELLMFSIPLALASAALYLPFYVGFSSQAGGVLANVIYPTRATQLWIMFGGLFVPLLAFLLYQVRKAPADWSRGFLLAGVLALLLWVFSIVLGVASANADIARQFIPTDTLSSTWDILKAAIERRIAFGGGLLTLVVLIGAAGAYLAAVGPQPAGEQPRPLRSPLPFVLMLILFGGLLVLAPEFIFLRDQFGSRINTVFKFYYEAWALWSIATAFAVAVMLSELRGRISIAYTTLILFLVAAGLVFLALALPNKTDDFQAADPQQRTLDGAAYRAQVAPDDAQAILWLKSAPLGVIAEASKPNASYTEYARVSTYSGLPAVLGWDGHEGQWRGSFSEMGSRQEDLRTLYSTHDWPVALAILKQYDVRYVYVGPLERQTYPVYDEKFAQNLPVIYNQGQVIIYRVP